MAKYAKGKKSYAISDRGGQRVRYTQLKTTWDGLRVSPDEWEPKHPQLTPAKNVIDAQQLFQPRSTGQDREDVVIYIAYTFDPFTPSHLRKSIGCAGHGSQGKIDIYSSPVPSGTAGTGAVGTEELELSINETGVAGTGAVGTELGFLEVTGNAGNSGTGAVGIEATELSINEAGVAGTGGVGAEDINIMGWGNMGWGIDTWGDGR
tara:strand:+ start:1167 stop:1784 length:618 start_codon:yes stop_codon:yes gene_type:complete